MADWLTHQAELSKRRLKLLGLAEELATREPGENMSNILSEDDKSELLMRALVTDITSTDTATMLYRTVEQILYDKLVEVIVLINKERLERPMNGDGHNYALRKAEDAIKRKFGL